MRPVEPPVSMYKLRSNASLFLQRSFPDPRISKTTPIIQKESCRRDALGKKRKIESDHLSTLGVVALLPAKSQILSHQQSLLDFGRAKVKRSDFVSRRKFGDKITKTSVFRDVAKATVVEKDLDWPESDAGVFIAS